MRPLTSQGFYLHQLPHYALLSAAIEGARVLQLGGGGYTAQYAALLGAKVTCALESEAEVAQNRELYRGPSVTFSPVTLPRLPFADASFDVVMAFEVAAGVEDVDALCAELRRVLAPSGFALLTLPNFSRDDLQEIMGEGSRDVPQRSPAEVYACLVDRFAAVTLFSQTPFMGYFLTLHTGQSPRPFDVSYELLDNEPETVLYHGFLVSDLEMVVEEDRLVQVPFSHLVDRLQEGLRTLHRALERKNNALLEMREELVLLHGMNRQGENAGGHGADARLQAIGHALEAAEERGGAGEELLEELRRILEGPSPDGMAMGGTGPRVSANEARLLLDGLQNLDSVDEDDLPDVAPAEAPATVSPLAPEPADDDRLVFVEDLAPFSLPGPVPLHSVLRAELRRLREALEERDTRLTSLGRWQDTLRAELTASRDRVLTHVQTLAAWDPEDALTRGWAELGAILVQLCAAAGFSDEDEVAELLTALPDGDAAPTLDTAGERGLLRSALAEAHEALEAHAGRAESLEMALEAARLDRDALEEEIRLLRERNDALESAPPPDAPEPDPRLDDLARQVAEALTRAAEAEARQADAEARQADAEARLLEAETSLNDAESRLAEAESHLAEAQARPADAPQSADATEGADLDTQATVDTLRGLLRAEQDRARDLELALEAAEHRAAPASDSPSVDAPPLHTIAQAEDDLAAERDALADQLATATARLAELTTQVDALKADAEEATTQRAEVARLRAALEAAEAAPRWPSPADDIVTTLLPAHPAHAALEARLKELEPRLQEAEAERDVLQAALDLRENELEKMAEQLAQRGRDLAQLHADLEHAWSQSIDQGSVSLTSDEPREALDALEDPVAQMEARITDLHTQLDERDQLLDELRQDLDLKRSHVATLQSLVERQRRELKLTREKVQAAIEGIVQVQEGL